MAWLAGGVDPPPSTVEVELSKPLLISEKAYGYRLGLGFLHQSPKQPGHSPCTCASRSPHICNTYNPFNHVNHSIFLIEHHLSFSIMSTEKDKSKVHKLSLKGSS